MSPPVYGLIRSTLAESMTATQTEPNPVTRPTGCGSASLAVSFFMPGSIRATTSAQAPPVDQRPLSSAMREAQGAYGSFTVPFTLFVEGSTRTILFAFGTATQSAPGDATRLMCCEQQASLGPTRIVATTRFVAGSIRETLGPPALATHTAPGETEIPAGCGPTPMVAVTLFVAGSKRETAFPAGCESQTAPSPATAASGGETLIRATTALRLGSIRMSDDSAVLIAQTAPSPTVRGP